MDGYDRSAQGRGRLRVYLGVAHGVGKTHALLAEGCRRADRGSAVCIGAIDTKGRPRCDALLHALDPVLAVGGSSSLEVRRCLAAGADVVLVDDIGRVDRSGGPRWAAVGALLARGIDVVASVDIASLESMQGITPAMPRDEPLVPEAPVPDAFVAAADQVELLDIAPEALLRRIAHGNIFSVEQWSAARAAAFEPARINVARQLAFEWMAGWVRSRQRGPRGSSRRVLVAVSGAPASAGLVRRASRLLTGQDGELVAVHVLPSTGDAVSASPPPVRDLVEALGGRYLEVTAEDPAEALVSTARSMGATQLVVGAPGQPHAGPFERDVLDRLLRLAPELDLVVVHHDGLGAVTPGRPGRPQRLPLLSYDRHHLGWAIAVGGIVALTAAASAARAHVDLTAVLLAYLVVVLLAALAGGRRPGIAAALGASVTANWFFTPPVHSFSVANSEDVAALVVFVAVALTVAALEDRVARREADAAQARLEAETLARATAALSAVNPLVALCEVLCSALGLLGCAVLEPADPLGGVWQVLAAAGMDPPARPDGPAARGVPIGTGGAMLVVRAHNERTGADHVVSVVADQLAVALEHRVLQAQASQSAVVAEADRLRVGLLRSVSHDLRSPLAAIKADVTTLQRGDVAWNAVDVQRILSSVVGQCDRLDRVVGNLLDASRLQAGEMRLHLRPTALEDVVATATAGAVPGIDEDALLIDAEATVPLALADAELLERAVANVLSNAVAWNPPGRAVRVVAEAVANEVVLRVIDHGPGIAPGHRARVLRPFQRSGDRSTDAGAGLGLAIASGFVLAMGGRFELTDTPGGGLTVVIALPCAEQEEP